jgi:DNA-binding MarR family transcriptional regulator
MPENTIVLDNALETAIDRFWETIPPLWSSIRAHIRGIAVEQHGISEEQFHILRHVRRGISSVSELAAVKNISRPAVSQAIDILVSKNLVTRTQSSDDRRFVHLELTPNGSALLDEVSIETRLWMKARMAALNIDELQNVHYAMDALHKILD